MKIRVAGKHKVNYNHLRVLVSILFLLLSTSLTSPCQEKSAAAPGHPAQSAQFPPSDSSTERFDVLAIGGSDLHASPPLLGEQIVLPKYTRELLRVQWRRNDPIDLYVIRPTGIPRPPVVLFLYGFPSESDRFRNEALCEKLTRNGFAAVGFVSAFTGQRYHDRPMKEWFVSELQESLVTSVHDVQMILDYLDTRSDLDMNRVGMFGQGSGGTIAILSASADPRIKAVDVMDPWADWPDWMAKSPLIPEGERPTYLTPAFLSKIAWLDPIRSLAQVKPRPLRLQENLFNAAMPEDVRNRLEATLPANALIIEYHSVEEYREKVSANAKMLDWLQAQLHSSAEKISSTRVTEAGTKQR